MHTNPDEKLTPLVNEAISALQDARADDLEELALRLNRLIAGQRLEREDAMMAQKHNTVLRNLLDSMAYNIDLARRLTRGSSWDL